MLKQTFTGIKIPIIFSLICNMFFLLIVYRSNLLQYCEKFKPKGIIAQKDIFRVQKGTVQNTI